MLYYSMIGLAGLVAGWLLGFVVGWNSRDGEDDKQFSKPWPWS